MRGVCIDHFRYIQGNEDLSCNIVSSAYRRYRGGLVRWRICACSYTDGDASGRRPGGANADSSSVADVRPYKHTRTLGHAAADGHIGPDTYSDGSSDCYSVANTYADGASDCYA